MRGFFLLHHLLAMLLTQLGHLCERTGVKFLLACTAKLLTGHGFHSHSKCPANSAAACLI
jgi:hypothetical protein